MSTTAPDAGDALTAVVLQITQHAERLAVVDEREAAHDHELAERLAELARHLAETSGRVEQMHAIAARQAAVLDSLDGLEHRVAALAERLTDLAGHDGNDTDSYQPAPSPRWWKLDGEERAKAITRLRAWVERVYRPSYGHLAAALGPCWEQHLLCLFGLDWLMELWSVLYLTPERDPPLLASQAEWQTRLLPALAEQMHLDTTRCHHNQQRPGGPQQAETAWPRRNSRLPTREHPGGR